MVPLQTVLPPPPLPSPFSFFLSHIVFIALYSNQQPEGADLLSTLDTGPGTDSGIAQQIYGKLTWKSKLVEIFPMVMMLSNRDSSSSRGRVSSLEFPCPESFVARCARSIGQAVDSLQECFQQWLGRLPSTHLHCEKANERLRGQL